MGRSCCFIPTSSYPLLWQAAWIKSKVAGEGNYFIFYRHVLKKLRAYVVTLKYGVIESDKATVWEGRDREEEGEGGEEEEEGGGEEEEEGE